MATDETLNENEVVTPETVQPSEALNTDKTVPYERFKEVNEQMKFLRSEMDEFRTAQQKADTDRQAEEKQRLVDQKDYQALNAISEQQVIDLQAENKALQAGADRDRESLMLDIQRRTQELPEHLRSLVPDYSDPAMISEWLTNALPSLMETPKPNAPNLDGGAGSSSAPDVTKGLTNRQSSIADAARNAGYNVDNKRVSQYANNPQKLTDIDKQE